MLLYFVISLFFSCSVFGICSWFGIALWTRERDGLGTFAVPKISLHVSSSLLIPTLHLQSLVPPFPDPKLLAFGNVTLGRGLEHVPFGPRAQLRVYVWFLLFPVGLLWFLQE